MVLFRPWKPKINVMQETVIGKDKALEEENALAIKFLSQLVAS